MPANARPRTAHTSANRPRPRRPTTALRPGAARLWRSTLEGAAAGLCGVAAMVALAATALSMLDVGSFGSLWPMATALTAMAVGGTLSAGPGPSTSSGSTGSGLASLFGGGGGIGPSMNGSADIMPLGVTVVGTLVLWFAFSRRLEQLGPSELAVRVVTAGTAAVLGIAVVASFAQGNVSVSMAKAMGGIGGGKTGSGSNPLGNLFGSGAISGKLSMSYHVDVVAAAFGAILWIAVALTIGCLINRKARLSPSGMLGRLRPGWSAGTSALVRTVIVLATVPLAILLCAGLVLGSPAQTAAAAALLIAPNVLVVILTLGLGAPWTAGVHPVQSSGGGLLSGLLGALGGSKSVPLPAEHTEHLHTMSAGGWPLWLTALPLTGAILLGCAIRAARAGYPTPFLPLHPYRGPLARHLGLAERFGITTGLLCGGAAWLAEASGSFSLSIFGAEMSGTRAQLAVNPLSAAILGLAVGALTGFIGSTISTGTRRAYPWAG